MWGHWSPQAHGLPPGLGGDRGPLRAPLCHPDSWPCSLSMSASSATGTWMRRHTGPSPTSKLCVCFCVIPTGLSTSSDIIKSLREDGLMGLLAARTLSTEAPAHRGPVPEPGARRPRLHPQPLTHPGFPETLRASGLADRSDEGEAHGKGSGKGNEMHPGSGRVSLRGPGGAKLRRPSGVSGPGLLLPR